MNFLYIYLFLAVIFLQFTQIVQLNANIYYQFDLQSLSPLKYARENNIKRRGPKGLVKQQTTLKYVTLTKLTQQNQLKIQQKEKPLSFDLGYFDQ